MPESRMTRLITLFERALEVPQPQRAEFLARATADDARLRDELTSLLEAHESSADYFDDLAAAVISPAYAAVIDAPPAGPRWEGRRIGAYRVVREVGRGGMSRVFLAERADGAFEQRAALKLLRPGFDSDIDVQRFRAERQILASLDHPNIARLLDGGMTDDGLPYLVLEYVDGLPLDRYCEDRGLSTRQRLDLFLTVAGAVEHAHRHSIVHRDLKPSNVLVTSDGVVKLLDFGVAKLLEQGAPGSTRTTRTAHRWMTPEYAAPEQVRGTPVTPRTDVYQLGVVLYELLTGRTPFRRHAGSPYDLETAVLSREPDPLGGALRGDVDAIVLKALRKDPSERYDSAREFADEVRRYLTGYPVHARRQTLSYRARRFSTRNRVGLAAAGSAVLLVAASVASIKGERARTQRALAEARAAESAPSIVRGRASGVIAVAPFRVSGADSSVFYLREGMPDLLSAALARGGPEGMPVADPGELLATWHRAAPTPDADLARADVLAAARGAGVQHLVLGAVVGSGDRLVFTASLVAVETGRTRATAAVTGSADSLAALVDRMTVQLLAGWAGERDERRAVLAGTPLAAVRAYLDGRVALRRAAYDQALLAHQRALAADTTFAVAALELSRVAGWVGDPAVRRRGYQLAWAHRERLSANDRIYLQAALGPRYPDASPRAEAIAAWERAAAVAPEQPDAWFELGDVVFHSPWLDAGAPVNDGGRAAALFRRALERAPDYAPALQHLLQAAASAGDTATVRAVATVARHIEPGRELQDFFDWRAAQALGDTAALRRTSVDRMSATALSWLALTSLFDGIAPADAARAVEVMVRRATTGEERARALLGVHAVALAQGRSRAAAEAAAAIRELASDEPEGARLQVLDALFGGGDAAVAANAAAALVQAALPTAGAPAERQRWMRDQCVLGPWYLARGARQAAVEVADRLRAAARAFDGEDWPPGERWPPEARFCALLVDAGVAVEARRADAPALLDSLDAALAAGHNAASLTWDAAILTTARLFERAGNPRRALAALRRRNRFYRWPHYLATQRQEEGRLAATLGDAGATCALAHALVLRAGGESPSSLDDRELARLYRQLTPIPSDLLWNRCRGG